jgi:hypothetical protein
MNVVTKNVGCMNEAREDWKSCFIASAGRGDGDVDLASGWGPIVFAVAVGWCSTKRARRESCANYKH